MAMSIGTWIAVLVVSGLAAFQPPATAAEVERVLRNLVAGRDPAGSVRLESECLQQGRFMRAAAYGTRVVLWNRERQGTLSAQQLRSLLNALVAERFAAMPASFGEGEDDSRRRSVKMTCRVRFTDGTLTKDVIQLEKGEQSAALKRLADGIINAATAATRNAAPVQTLGAGLEDIANARLAVETLRITMRTGAGRGVREPDARGWVLRIDGRDLEIEPDDGARTTRRLEDGAVRELARALVDARFASLPPNVQTTDYVEVTVAVLGHEHAVQGRQFSGSDTQAAEVRTRFAKAVAHLTALRQR